MAVETPHIRLLLVDDEDDFRLSTSRALERRGFSVTQAASGREALDRLATDHPDVIILDLRMPGIDGIETLQRIREQDTRLPVVVLTGHGDLQDAYAGIKLGIVDFLQKPIDIELLAARVRHLLTRSAEPTPLRERTIAELMTPASLYPRLQVEQPVREVFETLTELLYRSEPASTEAPGIRSALVFAPDQSFLGLVRFNDLLKLVLPPFLIDSPYSSYFTGMFLAQCKVIGKRSFAELMAKRVVIDLQAPLLEAVQLMVRHRLNSLPVLDGARVVGVLRDRAIILEMARNMALTG